jgi:hypothetical protein
VVEAIVAQGVALFTVDKQPSSTASLTPETR